MSVLALLYLPIPRGLIGTEWLTTQIAKFVAISPFLGRWILFIGYPKRVARQIAGRVNLAEGNNYQILSENAKGSDLLDQVSNALSTRQFVLIEHSVFPSFPEYLTIRYLPPQSKGAPLSGVLPILIPASEWRDSLSKTVSFVLKSKYGVPLDEEDMLKGQMERGGLLVIFENMGKLGEKLPEFFSEIESAMGTQSLEKCYFIACWTSTTTQLSNQSTILVHLVAREIHGEASAPKV